MPGTAAAAGASAGTSGLKLAEHEPGERGRSRIVEDQVAGSRSPVAAASRFRSSTAVSESNPRSRNDRGRLHRIRGGMPQDGRGLRPDRPGEPAPAAGPGPARPAAAASPPAARSRPTAARTGPRTRPRSRAGSPPERACAASAPGVDPGRQHRRTGPGQPGVEQLQSSVRAQRGHPGPPHPGPVRLAQLPGHLRGLLPQSPGQRHPGQPAPPPPAASASRNALAAA